MITFLGFLVVLAQFVLALTFLPGDPAPSVALLVVAVGQLVMYPALLMFDSRAYAAALAKYALLVFLGAASVSVGGVVVPLLVLWYLVSIRRLFVRA